ncbi:MAG: hypothetical protein KDM63_17725 [Verrucomicrobiae bacterium]|nr:hypothetical protein [Verrucomicrobiae bacterium]
MSPAQTWLGHWGRGQSLSRFGAGRWALPSLVRGGKPLVGERAQASGAHQATHPIRRAIDAVIGQLAVDAAISVAAAVVTENAFDEAA